VKDLRNLKDHHLLNFVGDRVISTVVLCHHSYQAHERYETQVFPRADWDAQATTCQLHAAPEWPWKGKRVSNIDESIKLHDETVAYYKEKL